MTPGRWQEIGALVLQTIMKYRAVQQAEALQRAVVDLRAYVDFLHAQIHDLTEESSAYRMGLEDGINHASREFAARIKNVKEVIDDTRAIG